MRESLERGPTLQVVEADALWIVDGDKVRYELKPRAPDAPIKKIEGGFSATLVPTIYLGQGSLAHFPHATHPASQRGNRPVADEAAPQTVTDLPMTDTAGKLVVAARRAEPEFSTDSLARASGLYWCFETKPSFASRCRSVPLEPGSVALFVLWS